MTLIFSVFIDDEIEHRRMFIVDDARGYHLRNIGQREPLQASLKGPMLRLISSSTRPSFEVYPKTTASTATLIFCETGIAQITIRRNEIKSERK